MKQMYHPEQLRVSNSKEKFTTREKHDGFTECSNNKNR